MLESEEADTRLWDCSEYQRPGRDGLFNQTDSCTKKPGVYPLAAKISLCCFALIRPHQEVALPIKVASIERAS